MFRPLRFRPQLCLRAVRYNSTAAPESQLLQKIKSDLKDAMRAKDTTKLNVIRSLISDINNAAKTTTPIDSDFQIFKLLHKHKAQLKDASAQYVEAGRVDLSEKAAEEIKILDTYSSQVATVPMEEIEAAVKDVVGKMRGEGKMLNIGTVMKNLVKPGGVLCKKNYDGKEVARVAREAIYKK
ncbi:hypothetical protein FQN50_008467 [Emmonsiellopsis sp. PD_5]|nr:hypothetical protein FQN50_008467 [Emmonsiellopsis sp. PD_5]